MSEPADFFAERRARRSYQSPDVCELADITYRQLDYWTRTGLLNSSGHASTGSGDARWYRDTDVVRAAVVSALLKAGLTLVRITVALQTIRARVLTHHRQPA